MKPFLIVILMIIAAGIMKAGALPLLFVVGGIAYWIIQGDKSGGESIFPWIGAFALVVGIGSIFV